MNAREARAYVKMRDQVVRAVDSCLAKLTVQERTWAEAYWADAVKSAVSGGAYGAAPIDKALVLLAELED